MSPTAEFTNCIQNPQIIIGIDLTANESKKSGLAIISKDKIFIDFIFANYEIIELIYLYKPKVIAIDAPLTLSDKRTCDKQMKKYGAMPLALPSIHALAQRAIKLVETIPFRTNIIEVFPTATAKIFKIYSRNFQNVLKSYESTLKMNIKTKLNKDTSDAVLAALTGWLYHKHLTVAVGDENGSIIIPDENRIEEIYDKLKIFEIRSWEKITELSKV